MILRPINFNDSSHKHNRNKMTKCEMIQLVIEVRIEDVHSVRAR